MCSNPRVSAMLLRVLDRDELRETVWRRSHAQPAANKRILGASQLPPSLPPLLLCLRAFSLSACMYLFPEDGTDGVVLCVVL